MGSKALGVANCIDPPSEEAQQLCRLLSSQPLHLSLGPSPLFSELSALSLSLSKLLVCLLDNRPLREMAWEKDAVDGGRR